MCQTYQMRENINKEYYTCTTFSLVIFAKSIKIGFSQYTKNWVLRLPRPSDLCSKPIGQEQTLDPFQLLINWGHLIDLPILPLLLLHAITKINKNSHLHNSHLHYWHIQYLKDGYQHMHTSVTDIYSIIEQLFYTLAYMYSCILLRHPQAVKVAVVSRI